MKIKLTKEQMNVICAATQRHLYNKTFRDVEFVINIDDAQIIKEKSNREKWQEVLKKLAGIYGTQYSCFAHILDKQGYDATKAYEKVCGGK